MVQYSILLSTTNTTLLLTCQGPPYKKNHIHLHSFISLVFLLQEIIERLALIDSEDKVRLLLNFEEAHLYGLR